MDFTLSTLGLALPLAGRRRRLSLTEQSPQKQQTKNYLQDRDSFLVYLEQSYALNLSQQLQKQQHQQEHKKDDDTASTLSSSTSTDDESCSSFGKMVTFAEELVTAVHTRPFTSREDKYYLHYSEHDYVDFKVEYVTGRTRTRQVSFAHQVVSQETIVPPPIQEHKQHLYYSESELQT
jgi:hypothetical protein